MRKKKFAFFTKLVAKQWRFRLLQFLFKTKKLQSMIEQPIGFKKLTFLNRIAYVYWIEDGHTLTDIFTQSGLYRLLVDQGRITEDSIPFTIERNKAVLMLNYSDTSFKQYAKRRRSIGIRFRHDNFLFYFILGKMHLHQEAYFNTLVKMCEDQEYNKLPDILYDLDNYVPSSTFLHNQFFRPALRS